eukprot:6968108-Pyramimonas_sp.AAC.1
MVLSKASNWWSITRQILGEDDRTEYYTAEYYTPKYLVDLAPKIPPKRLREHDLVLVSVLKASTQSHVA